MKYIAAVILTALSLPALSAVSETVIGKVTQMRTSTDFTPTTSAQQEVIFKVDTGHVQQCTWLGIPRDNPPATSFLLAAYASGSEVRVWYYSDLTTGSGSSVCQAYTIELR